MYARFIEPVNHLPCSGCDAWSALPREALGKRPGSRLSSAHLALRVNGSGSSEEPRFRRLGRRRPMVACMGPDVAAESPCPAAEDGMDPVLKRVHAQTAGTRLTSRPPERASRADHGDAPRVQTAGTRLTSRPPERASRADRGDAPHVQTAGTRLTHRPRERASRDRGKEPHAQTAGTRNGAAVETSPAQRPEPPSTGRGLARTWSRIRPNQQRGGAVRRSSGRGGPAAPALRRTRRPRRLRSCHR